MAPFMGEFVGTALLVLIGDAVVANNVLARTKGNGSGWLAVTTGWALAYFVAMYCVAPLSGAHLNPAVTIGLWMAGLFEGELVMHYIGAQLLGAFAGALVMWLAYLPHWSKTEDSAVKLGAFCTAPAIRAPLSNLLNEAIATAVLVLGILMLKEFQMNMDDGSTVNILLGPVAVMPVALLVFAIGLCLGGPTGAAINPARDFSPRLAHALLPIPGKGPSDWGYALIPVIGPIVGGLAAAWIFKSIVVMAS
ncbi:MAG: aquaporin family protein [Planctomycetes bacterium]|nr:aquaporin family protein [Planctomycetota bacterium]